MAIVFYVLGTLGLIAGAYGTEAAIYTARQLTSSASQVDPGGAYYAVGAMSLAAPAIALAIADLFLLAIGGVLRRLDKVVHYARLTHELQSATPASGERRR